MSRPISRAEKLAEWRDRRSSAKNHVTESTEMNGLRKQHRNYHAGGSEDRGVRNLNNIKPNSARCSGDSETYSAERERPNSARARVSTPQSRSEAPQADLGDRRGSLPHAACSSTVSSRARQQHRIGIPSTSGTARREAEPHIHSRSGVRHHVHKQSHGSPSTSTSDVRRFTRRGSFSSSTGSAACEVPPSCGRGGDHYETSGRHRHLPSTSSSSMLSCPSSAASCEMQSSANLQADGGIMERFGVSEASVDGPHPDRSESSNYTGATTQSNCYKNNSINTSQRMMMGEGDGMRTECSTMSGGVVSERGMKECNTGRDHTTGDEIRCNHYPISNYSHVDETQQQIENEEKEGIINIASSLKKTYLNTQVQCNIDSLQPRTGSNKADKMCQTTETAASSDSRTRQHTASQTTEATANWVSCSSQTDNLTMHNIGVQIESNELNPNQGEEVMHRDRQLKQQEQLSEMERVLQHLLNISTNLSTKVESVLALARDGAHLNSSLERRLDCLQNSVEDIREKQRVRASDESDARSHEVNLSNGGCEPLETNAKPITDASCVEEREEDAVDGGSAGDAEGEEIARLPPQMSLAGMSAISNKDTPFCGTLTESLLFSVSDHETDGGGHASPMRDTPVGTPGGCRASTGDLLLTPGSIFNKPSKSSALSTTGAPTGQVGPSHEPAVERGDDQNKQISSFIKSCCDRLKDSAISRLSLSTYSDSDGSHGRLLQKPVITAILSEELESIQWSPRKALVDEFSDLILERLNPVINSQLSQEMCAAEILKVIRGIQVDILPRLGKSTTSIGPSWKRNRDEDPDMENRDMNIDEQYQAAKALDSLSVDPNRLIGLTSSRSSGGSITPSSPGTPRPVLLPAE